MTLLEKPLYAAPNVLPSAFFPMCTLVHNSVSEFKVHAPLKITHADEEMAPLSFGIGPPNSTDTLRPVKRVIVWRTSSRYADKPSIALHVHERRFLYPTRVILLTSDTVVGCARGYPRLEHLVLWPSQPQQLPSSHDLQPPTSLLSLF